MAFEIINLLTYYALTCNVHFWLTDRSVECLSHIHLSRSSGRDQGHRSKTACLCVLLMSGLPSLERLSCLHMLLIVNYAGSHEMSPRYKFVVQVVLMQNNGQGIG